MVAVDTNVLVRFLTSDDRAQTARARALLDSEDVFVATTVLLELVWVLRSAYGFDEDSIIEALTKLAGLPNLHMEDSDRLARAMLWRSSGIDFADALHIAASPGDFRTFDERLVKRARRAGIDRVRAV